MIDPLMQRVVQPVGKEKTEECQHMPLALINSNSHLKFNVFESVAELCLAAAFLSLLRQILHTLHQHLDVIATCPVAVSVRDDVLVVVHLQDFSVLFLLLHHLVVLMMYPLLLELQALNKRWSCAGFDFGLHFHINR